VFTLRTVDATLHLVLHRPSRRSSSAEADIFYEAMLMTSVKKRAFSPGSKPAL